MRVERGGRGGLEDYGERRERGGLEQGRGRIGFEERTLECTFSLQRKEQRKEGKTENLRSGGGIEKGKWGEKGGKEGKEQLDVIVDLL